jgi:acetylornithine deacetylase
MNIKNTYLYDVSEKLIGFDTVSFKSNSECSNYVANELLDMGFDVKIENFDDNGKLKQQIIASIGPKVEGGIILSGHMDTVPWETQKGWTKDALKLQIEDDKLFGRGTCDMKLFIAQCLAVFRDFDLSNLKKPIVCIFTADEEIGCLGAKRIVKKLDSLVHSVPIPKTAIIGEPTEFNIINTHKGIVHFDIVIKGVAGHSSRPDLGKNSIEQLGDIISLINQINFEFKKNLDQDIQKVFPDFPYNHLHMAIVNAGSALNMIPDETRLRISYRSFPMEPSDKVLNYFKQELVKANFKDVYIEKEFMAPGLKRSSDTKYESVLKEITKKDTQSVSFATDAGYLSQADINCYVCGPGSIKQAHQPDEFMELSQLTQGITFINTVLNKLI